MAKVEACTTIAKYERARAARRKVHWMKLDAGLIPPEPKPQYLMTAEEKL